MALEPRTVTATQEENPELRDMTRRFWVGVVLTAPLLAIAMGSMFWRDEFMRILAPIGVTGVHLNLPRFEFLLATPVVLWCGLPFFQRFWTSLVNRSPNMFTLIGLGTGVAYIYSVVATIAPQIFPASLRRAGAWADIPTSTSKPPPPSPRSSCSARSWNSAPAAAPAPPSARCSI